MNRNIAHTLANADSTKYDEIKGNEPLKRLARQLSNTFRPEEKLKARMTKADLLAIISSIQNQRVGADDDENTEGEDEDAEGEDEEI